MELRRQGREQVQGKIRIHWQDRSGATFGSLGRLVDVSEGGLCADVDRRIEPATVVQIESSDARVAGLAVVRHCRQKGMGYRVGIQFTSGLKRTGRNLPESSAARGD
jgi:hypothetical protein